MALKDFVDGVIVGVAAIGAIVLILAMILFYSAPFVLALAAAYWLLKSAGAF